MPIIDFKGTWTALVTPFKEDGNIDYEGLEKNIEFQVSEGITGILPVGTTGESPTLTPDEHNEVIAFSNSIARGRCDVLAGTGSNSTREALNHTKHAVDHGIDKVLLVDCYYNGPSSLELRREYYQRILDSFKDVKIVIYVIPGRTGTVILPEDITILSEEYSRVVAIKEATGDLDRMKRERELMPEMSIMSGDDDKTYTMMTDEKIKASGVISVVSNIVPGPLNEMVSALLNGEIEKGKTLASKLKPLFSIVTVKAETERVLKNGKKIKVIDRFRNPLAIKTAMMAMGLPSGHPRNPLGKMTKEGINIVKNALLEVLNKNPEILEPIASFYNVDVEARLKSEKSWENLSY